MTQIKLCQSAAKETEYTSTYVPEYDTSISEDLKQYLASVYINPVVRPKVEAFKLDAKSHIIKYLIKQDQPSTVLTPYQLSNLAERMQGIYRRS